VLLLVAGVHYSQDSTPRALVFAILDIALAYSHNLGTFGNASLLPMTSNDHTQASMAYSQTRAASLCPSIFLLLCPF
jgi:hypothetical protein